MTPDVPPPIVSVTGGGRGVDAHLDDMERMASLIGGVGGDMTGLALAGHRYLADPDVLASAVLDPAGSARFEWAMLRALDGDGGLTTVAIGIGVSAVKLKAAAVAYRTTDALQAAFMDVAEFVGAPVTFVVSLGEVVVRTGVHVLEGDSPKQALERTITEHPGIVDDVVGSVPGLMAALAATNPLARGAWGAIGFSTTVPGGAAGLARLYPDGRPRVTPQPLDADPLVEDAPENLADVMVGLAHRDRLPPQLDVRVIRTIGPDGKERLSAIVDIPGTKTWNLPGQQTDMLQDLGTNLHGVANDTTTYERAVRIALDDALDRAGVRSGDRVPVMLVGHSQGGIVALHASGALTDSDRYDITHVLTAGAPVGEVDNVPESVRVLSIENDRDIVPQLDSQRNPDRSNWTTVAVSEQNGTVEGNHGSLIAYVPAAGAVDASHNPSVQAYRDSAGEFLGGNFVATRPYGIERVP